MKFVILSDGRRFDIAGGFYGIINGSTVQMTTANLSVYYFTCADAATAAAFLLALDAFVQSTDNISANPIA